MLVDIWKKYDDDELEVNATVWNFWTVQKEGAFMGGLQVRVDAQS